MSYFHLLRNPIIHHCPFQQVCAFSWVWAAAPKSLTIGGSRRRCSRQTLEIICQGIISWPCGGTSMFTTTGRPPQIMKTNSSNFGGSSTGNNYFRFLSQFLSLFLYSLTLFFRHAVSCLDIFHVYHFLFLSWSNRLNRNYEQEYRGHGTASIDESMVKFKGRLGFKQYMPNKPIKWGIKVWSLCESTTGYLHKWVYILFYMHILFHKTLEA